MAVNTVPSHRAIQGLPSTPFLFTSGSQHAVTCCEDFLGSDPSLATRHMTRAHHPHQSVARTFGKSIVSPQTTVSWRWRFRRRRPWRRCQTATAGDGGQEGHAAWGERVGGRVGRLVGGRGGPRLGGRRLGGRGAPRRAILVVLSGMIIAYASFLLFGRSAACFRAEQRGSREA